MDPSHSTPSHSHGHQNPNSSDLMASAKLVADAAKSTFNRESDKVDQGRVAGAASDLLGAACHYGKLEEKSFGKYVEKAEDYLHQYGSSHPSAAATGHPAPHAGAPATEAAAAAPHHSSAHSGEEQSGSGGHGDYLKMAQGLLNSGGEKHSGSGGGYGEYVEKAQDYLHQYGSSHTSAAATGDPAPHAGAPAAEAAAAAPHHSSAHSGDEEHSGSGGHGDYLKMAQGLLNSGGEERSGSGGGYGDYVKMAQGFLKK